ncbi:hypothetical protein B194_3981 [Serratia plymuthica A30]|nr:hypothetical protein B194_3981 [Serratia plymuthica A30]
MNPTVTAGMSSLASQAAVALVENQGNLSKTLKVLGRIAGWNGAIGRDKNPERHGLLCKERWGNYQFEGVLK